MQTAVFIYLLSEFWSVTGAVPSLFFYALFLSDPSPIIGYACHWLTDCGLVNLIDVSDEGFAGNSLLNSCLKLRFGHKA